MSNLDRAKAYLRAIEAEDPNVDAFFAPDVVQREFPNRLVPQGAPRYELRNAVEHGDRLALEVLWTATLRMPLGALPAGATLRAHFAVFLEYRNGLIASQHNYDCFDPF